MSKKIKLLVCAIGVCVVIACYIWMAVSQSVISFIVFSAMLILVALLVFFEGILDSVKRKRWVSLAACVISLGAACVCMYFFYSNFFKWHNIEKKVDALTAQIELVTDEEQLHQLQDERRELMSEGFNISMRARLFSIGTNCTYLFMIAVKGAESAIREHFEKDPNNESEF